MTIYQTIFPIFPYMVSIRKFKTHLSFDMSFPNSWKFPKKYMAENSIFEFENQIQDERGITFVSEFSNEGISKIVENITNIISYNKEREEKEKLLEDKVNELKNLFEKQNLTTLKNLKFDLNGILNTEKTIKNGPENIGKLSEGIIEE